MIKRGNPVGKGDYMEAIQMTKNTYTINDSVDVLFSKLDEAIDDMENGRVISEEEMWIELDAI